MNQYFANSANCFGSERSTPGMPSRGIFFIPVTYSLIFSWEWDEEDKSSSIFADTISSATVANNNWIRDHWQKTIVWTIPSSVPVAHIVTLNSPSNVLIWTCFCSHLRLEAPPPDLCWDDCRRVVPLWVVRLFARLFPELTDESLLVFREHLKGKLRRRYDRRRASADRSGRHPVGGLPFDGLSKAIVISIDNSFVS